MNRRKMLKLTAVGGAGLAIVGTQTSCKVKDIAFYVSTVVGTLGELSPLLPGAAATIALAVTAANDFLTAYKAGKFANATVIFQNLVGFIQQVASDVSVNNPTVKIILAIANVAIHAIAALMAGQANTKPAVMAARAQGNSAVQVIDRLTNPVTIDQIFAASRP